VAIDADVLAWGEGVAVLWRLRLIVSLRGSVIHVEIPIVGWYYLVTDHS
jgi:hypothetical protein